MRLWASASSSADCLACASAGWTKKAGEPVEARLLVDADHAALAQHALGADVAAEEQADGSVVFTVAVTNREGFRSFVLGFLDHAEVLGPPALRDDVVAWLRALAVPG